MERGSRSSDDCAIFGGTSFFLLATVEAVLTGEGDFEIPQGLVDHLEAGFVSLVALTCYRLLGNTLVTLESHLVELLELAVAGDAEPLALDDGEPVARIRREELTS